MANESSGKVALPSSRRGVKGFFSETARELRKVNWPSPREATRLTGIVLTVCVAQAAILLGLQFFFGAVIDILEKGKF
jgi:preprotein translocase SecE subunit